MNSIFSIHRCIFLLIFSALFVSSCSSSDSSLIDNTADAAQTTIEPLDSVTDGTVNEIELKVTTQIEFDITVPVYASDTLQVRIVWGEIDIAANWVFGESWSVSDDFPTNTGNQLIVTFSDGNGATTIGSYEFAFSTNSAPSSTLQITADKFDTDRWDSDGDGTSNYNELRLGTSPSAIEINNRVYEDFDLADVSQGLIKSVSGAQLETLYVVVAELAFFAGQATTILWPDDAWREVQSIDEASPEQRTTICNGGTTCQVVPGEYVVINHITDERSLLEVPYIHPDEQPGATLHPEHAKVITDADNQMEIASASGFSYACDGGGSLKVLNYTFSKNHERGEDLIFDECKVQLTDGIISNGSYQINGTAHMELRSHGNGNHSYIYRYNELSIVGNNGYEYHVTGQTVRSGLFNSYNPESSITEYIKRTPDGKSDELLADVRYHYECTRNNDLECLNGVVQNSLSGHQRVSITKVPTSDCQEAALLNRDCSQYPVLIEMLSQDGSFLYIEINADSMDMDYTTSSGLQIHSFGIENRWWASLWADSFCDYRRVRPHEKFGRPICVNGSSQYIGRNFPIP